MTVRTLNGVTFDKRPRLGYKDAFCRNLIPGAVFVDRARFEAAVSVCMLTATQAQRHDGKSYKPVMNVPEFRAMAWEVRAALARASQRELYVKGWEELTPADGTPGLRTGEVRPFWARTPGSRIRRPKTEG